MMPDVLLAVARQQHCDRRVAAHRRRLARAAGRPSRHADVLDRVRSMIHLRHRRPAPLAVDTAPCCCPA